MMQYPDSDDFSQAVPVNIALGSSDCTIDIYNIRIYESDLREDFRTNFPSLNIVDAGADDQNAIIGAALLGNLVLGKE